jgi:hypothetical protein
MKTFRTIPNESEQRLDEQETSSSCPPRKMPSIKIPETWIAITNGKLAGTPGADFMNQFRTQFTDKP